MLLNLIALGFWARLVFGAAVIHVDPFSKYGIETLQWKFPTPNGGDVYVNGTAQEALAGLMKLHPEAIAFKNETSEVNSILDKRADFSNAKFNCNMKEYGDCFKIGIITGIQYLRSLNGQPRNGPGPGNCGRVSCSYGNSIWWCNDERAPKTLEGWNSIADGAQFLVNHCAEGGKGKAYVHGQVFHHTHWNVIVRHDSC